LSQIGQRELADAELRLLAGRAPAELDRSLVALAQALASRSAAPGAEPSARRMVFQRADSLARPSWQPKGGYQLDPSLIHAVIRAESGFDSAARSPKGALGLMQILPETARDVAKAAQLAYGGEDWLLDPPTNMAVGQAWLRQLAATKTVQGSLIHLLAAYNAGEGRLAGWLAKDLARAGDDPLLFVESVPIAETRSYIKKVIANLWAYQADQGQRSPSLLALAENRWPELAPAGSAPPRPKAKAKARARAH
jgi:soluble lytic murein transglycosylase-like protein